VRRRARAADAPAGRRDIRKEGPSIAKLVKETRLAPEDLERTTELALVLAPLLKRLPVAQVVCGVLGYQSQGYKVNGVTVIEFSAKLRCLMPAPQTFALLGMHSSLVKMGMNEIMAVSARFAEALAGAGRAPRPPCLPAPVALPSKRRRLRL